VAEVSGCQGLSRPSFARSCFSKASRERCLPPVRALTDVSNVVKTASPRTIFQPRPQGS